METISMRGLKAQKHLAQGNALGLRRHNDGASKGKSIKSNNRNALKYNAFALTGRVFKIRKKLCMISGPIIGITH